MPRPAFFFLASTWRRTLAAGWVALGLVACTPLPSPPPATGLPPDLQPDPTPEVLERPKARWVPTGFDALPGWGEDALAEWWPALRQSCSRPAVGWQRVCEHVLSRPTIDGDAAWLRPWVERTFQVYRVESPQGQDSGLLTGYYEPQLRASRTPTAQYRVPLYAPPADLNKRQPYWTRRELDTVPTAQAALKGREIAWLEDPLDALVVQIQGSGQLLFQDADGRLSAARLAFAGHNGQPYRSVGAWLISQGQLKASEASWPGIKDWVRRNPRRLQEMLWQNPRMVFFALEPLPEPIQGPRGAQAVPLTPARSIAVDPGSVPYGTPVWLASTDPTLATPLHRLVMAQDTGSAITGAVRADYFWGWGDTAATQAGRTRQNLRMWVLWPR